MWKTISDTNSFIVLPILQCIVLLYKCLTVELRKTYDKLDTTKWKNKKKKKKEFYVNFTTTGGVK